MIKTAWNAIQLAMAWLFSACTLGRVGETTFARRDRICARKTCTLGRAGETMFARRDRICARKTCTLGRAGDTPFTRWGRASMGTVPALGRAEKILSERAFHLRIFADRAASRLGATPSEALK